MSAKIIEVFELTVKVYLINDKDIEYIQEMIARFIDSYLMQDEKYAIFHQTKMEKHYSFDCLYPIPADRKIYKGDNVYSFRIRTVDIDLLNYLAGGIHNFQTQEMKGLNRTIKKIPFKHLEKVYTITPMILKDAQGRGYWKDCMSFNEFEEMLKKSLIHKYEVFTGEKVQEDCELYTYIEVQNKCAIGVKCKDITLLGDKVSIQVADNETAQRIFYYALAGALGVRGSRGNGFPGYRFI